MGAEVSKFVSNQVQRVEAVSKEKKILSDLQKNSGEKFPGSDFHPSDRKNWMLGLGPGKIIIKNIVWPGTHDSATSAIGIPAISRPFAQCQTLSVYQQLVLGTRVLDIRIQENRRVCHGILISYDIDVVINDIKKFLSESQSEILILEIRTEYGHQDPEDFEEYLENQLGEYLIHQNDDVFEKTILDLLPRRVVCVWKPRNSPCPDRNGPLWSAEFLIDNWIDTDLPWTKFKSNLKYLSQQTLVISRRFFYRVENTVTPQGDNPVVLVKPVTERIRPYARVFISQCFDKGVGDRLQILSTDFIDEDFVDACAGVTHARIEGLA